MDRGDIMTVLPGEISQLFIATKNAIKGVMAFGTPDEVGIILGGTYEQSISQTITGCAPYCYMSEDEAKAKLIDPTIDYKGALESAQVTSLKSESVELQKQIEAKDALIKKLEDQIKKDQEEIKKASSNEITDLKLKEALKQNESDAATITSLTSELDGYKSNYESLKVQVDTLTTEKSALNEKISVLTKELKSRSDELELLSKKLQSDSLIKSELAEKEELIDKLKASLKESSDRIDQMRDLFNNACEKFNLKLDENGEWVMGS